MSNGQIHPAMNAAQGMLGGAIGSGLLTQGTLTTGQAYNQAVLASNISAGDSFRLSPRVRIEVDKVSNGYVIAVGSERLIAKDLEELQQHFTAQVVSKLVLEEGK